jgi:hypothetical protein
MEYCLVIALVVMAYSAMQIYAKRGLNAVIKAGADRMSPHEESGSMYKDKDEAFWVKEWNPNMIGRTSFESTSKQVVEKGEYKSGSISTSRSNFSGAQIAAVVVEKEDEAFDESEEGVRYTCTEKTQEKIENAAGAAVTVLKDWTTTKELSRTAIYFPPNEPSTSEETVPGSSSSVKTAATATTTYRRNLSESSVRQRGCHCVDIARIYWKKPVGTLTWVEQSRTTIRNDSWTDNWCSDTCEDTTSDYVSEQTTTTYTQTVNQCSKS